MDHRDELRVAALEHARAHFTMHAGQRMQLVNFFILAFAFLIAAFVDALGTPYVAAAIAAIGIALSLVFFGLELRTKQLVKIGEAALKPLERYLADELSIDELRLSERADCAPTPISYGRALRYFYGTSTLAFVFAAWWALAHSGLEIRF